MLFFNDDALFAKKMMIWISWNKDENNRIHLFSEYHLTSVGFPTIFHERSIKQFKQTFRGKQILVNFDFLTCFYDSGITMEILIPKGHDLYIYLR